MRYSRSRALFLTLALGSGLLAASAARADLAAVDADKPFLVKVHADWCGTCVQLNETWSQLEAKLGDGARFVILDVTDRERLQASQAQAERLGLAAFFAEYRGRTGTIGVLRGDDRGTVETLKGVTDLARYEAAVAEARAADPS